MRPPAFERLVDALSRFPSIGPKTAARIALWLLNQPPEASERIARAITEARQTIRRCRICFQYAEDELCPVCADPARDKSILCVVEEAVDVWSFERTGRYRGTYHVLGGAISPLDGIGPDELTVQALLERVADPAQGIAEVILATDPDTEGNATALFIADHLPRSRVKVSRLAHGLPVGGELAYSDDATLAEALAGRRIL
ncbi:MAG: recombination mediator RecR [Candidatus Hydrogenedentota bacterium]